MPVFSGLRTPDRRILVVTGHYGSGKTEFCVSLAMRLARMGYGPYRRLALIDLDIANPYFRSRERKAVLEAAGVGVYGNAYEHEIAAELPVVMHQCVVHRIDAAEVIGIEHVLSAGARRRSLAEIGLEQ